MQKQNNRQPGIHLHKTKPRTIDLGPAEWYWILIAKNGKTIAKSSETYKRKAGAVKSIRIVASHFENNHYYYDHVGGGVGDLIVY